MSPRRALPVVLLVLGAAVAAPTGPALAASAGTTISAPLPADALPVPAPKSNSLLTAQGFAPAPMPDPDLQRPLVDRMAERPRTAVVPNLFNQADRRNGDGFVQGSAGQYDPDHRLRPSPTLNLRLPLQ